MSNNSSNKKDPNGIYLPEKKFITELPDEELIKRIQLSVIRARVDACNMSKNNYTKQQILEELVYNHEWLSRKYPTLFKFACNPDQDLTRLSTFIKGIRKVNKGQETFENVSSQMGHILLQDMNQRKSTQKK